MRLKGAPTWLLVFATLGLLGCDDCPTGNGPSEHLPGGVISGRILAGGEPLPVRVLASGVVDGRVTHSHSTRADERGDFRLDCPAGDYYLEFDCSEGERFYYAHGQAVTEYDDRELIPMGADYPDLVVTINLAALEVAVYLTAASGHTSISIDRYPIGEDGVLERSSAHAYGVAGSGVVHLPMVGVSAGDCLIAVRLGGLGFSEEFWAPGIRDPQQADRIYVAPGAATQYTFNLIGPITNVSGKIEGSWQVLDKRRPSIEFLNQDSVRVGGCSANRDDGRFTMPIKVAEPFVARVEIDDVFQWIGGSDFESATLFEPGPEGIITDIDLVECGLILDVVDPAYASLDGMQVEVYGADQPETILHTIPGRASTGPRETISNLAPGTYLVRLNNYSLSVDWSRQWIDREDNHGSAMPIHVETPGDIVVVPVTLTSGGAMGGTVQWDPSEAIPPGAGRLTTFRLVLTDAATTTEIGAQTLYGLSDEIEDHDFILRGIRPGLVKLGARIASSLHGDSPDSTFDVTVWYPGTAAWDSAAVFEVAAGASIEGIEFELP